MADAAASTAAEWTFTQGVGAVALAGVSLWLLRSLASRAMSALRARKGARTTAVAAAAAGTLPVRDDGDATSGRARHQLNVVITGSTRGIGKALARAFVEAGDCVAIVGRKQADCDAAAKALRSEVASRLPAGVDAVVLALACDVSDASALDAMLTEARDGFPHGRVDVVIGNAGVAITRKVPLAEQPAAALRRLVMTNAWGALATAHSGIRALATQPGARDVSAHVFLMDGAGSRGNGTATFAAYGYSKAGLPQLLKSLVVELRGAAPHVGMHLLSPGMVVTDLLMGKSGADEGDQGASGNDADAPAGPTARVRRIFNVLSEHPETVAAWLVPRVRGIALSDKGSPASTGGAGVKALSGTYVKYLDMPGAAWRFLWNGLLRGCLFGYDRLGILGESRKAKRA